MPAMSVILIVRAKTYFANQNGVETLKTIISNITIISKVLFINL